MGDQSAAPPRSMGVTVLGAVMVAFGTLGTLSAPLVLLSRSFGARAGSSRVQDMMWSGTLGVWDKAWTALGMLLTLLLVASGIGVLLRRRWARKASLFYAIAAIALGFVAQLMNILLLYPRLFQLVQTGNTTERAGAIGGLFGGIVGGLFGMILPVAVLIVVTRPAIRRELGG